MEKYYRVKAARYHNYPEGTLVSATFKEGPYYLLCRAIPHNGMYTTQSVHKKDLVEIKLDTLKKHNVKVGDTVLYWISGLTPCTTITKRENRVIGRIKGNYYYTTDGIMLSTQPLWEVIKRAEVTTEVKDTPTTKPDGGPSKYYDFPFYKWVTVNDMVEYLSGKLWKEHSWIFKDILKAMTRWGEKDGTTKEYDARKMVYYSCRLLMSVTDKVTLRKYLQSILDDKQFQENNND